jgi:zinc protease
MKKILIVLALLVSLSVFAQTENSWEAARMYQHPDMPLFNELPENAEVLQLENGLKVLFLQNPLQPMASIITQIKVGSADEDFRTSGMSHMLEHLLFNGSAKWTQEEQYDLADMHGIYNNANTTNFFTNFMMVMPVDELEIAMDLQAEMLFHSIIPDGKFDKERGIVIGEIVQSRDHSGGSADSVIREVIYDGCSLALPTLGTKSTIENMSRDDVYDFYKNHYVPNNMVTTIAGNFNRDTALELLNKYFGSVPPGTVEKPEMVPAQYIGRTTSVSRRTGDSNVLALAYEAPAYGSPDFFPFLVMSHVLDTPTTGVLTKAIAELDPELQPSVGVWWERAEGFSRLVIELHLPDGADHARYYGMIQNALTDAMEYGVSDVDVQEIIATSETETLIEREQLRHLAIMAAEPIAQGGIDYFLNYLDNLASVTAESVTRVLGAYVVNSPHKVINIIPRSEVEGDASEVVVLPKRQELQNGATLISLQNSDSELFAMHIAVRDRSLLDGDNPGALNMVHRLLTKGVGGCDEICMSHKLRSLGAEIKLVDNPWFPMDNYYTNSRFSFIRVECAAGSGQDILSLILEMVQSATFSEEDFNGERMQQIGSMARNAGSARSIASRTLSEAVYGDHPLSKPAEGTAETLEKLSYDDIRKTFRKAFSPHNLIFTIVSPEEHQSLATAIELQLPERGRAGERMTHPSVTESDERIVKTVGGEMASIRVGSVLDIKPSDADALGLLVSILSDRIQQDLRETRGLSYSVGTSISCHGPVATFSGWINPPMPRKEEGETALLEAIKSFDPLLVTQGELDKARNFWKGRMMMRRLSSISQAYYLAMAELDGDLSYYTELFERYDSVTLEQLIRVGTVYLTNLPLITVVVE